MDKFPLLLDGRSAGELSSEQTGLYTWFSARCSLPEGLWCAWVVGDQGELRLGVLEPMGTQGTIRRRFSGRLTAPLGHILRGEVRQLEGHKQDGWEAAAAPEAFFRAPWLRRRLKGTTGALTRAAENTRYLALPYDQRKPFPLTTLFCFARLQRIGTSFYAVYRFDAQERPIFDME